MLTTDQQIKHIEDHQDWFDEYQNQPGADVRAYFLRYGGAHPDLYWRLCYELGIDPIEEYESETVVEDYDVNPDDEQVGV